MSFGDRAKGQLTLGRYLGKALSEPMLLDRTAIDTNFCIIDRA